MKIAEIREILQKDDVPEEVLQEIFSDSRKGVQNLVQAYMKRLEKLSREKLRVESMYEVESSFYKKGMNLIAGIDEVGRGPLAGPVTVAAVILKPHWFAAGLNDSKKVTPVHREELSKKIHEEAVDISIYSLPPEEIDAVNIYEATMMAMYQAVKNLKVQPDAVIVDAMPLHFPFPTVSMIHGDARSASVAAASIVAKVYRDHLMDEYDREYPGYGFAKNKGYGTAEHIHALEELGVTPIHRRSFEPVKSMVLGRY
ncbi:ribonuclease HII [Dialister sp.]|uniref:ribonuclease HII n=1 Tax=Dialister sp. TaxID=1955814 RepID=UPI002E804C86|nr:ribonuclease HII [Dialister sp.]MEE3452225.1 ribonuclease HII [Dialister sp.]